MLNHVTLMKVKEDLIVLVFTLKVSLYTVHSHNICDKLMCYDPLRNTPKRMNRFLSVVLASLQKSEIPFHRCMRLVVSLRTSQLTRIHYHNEFGETRGRCWCQKEGKGGIRSDEGEKGRFAVRARLEQLEWK